ncbi:MAG: hypothetical protein Q4D65_01705 [Peptostreptococcaceae bacterium]|nr:hypothetical protein [Peptostreptococcaceae bacterium]
MFEKLVSFGGDLLHLFIAPHRLAEDIDEEPRLQRPHHLLFLGYCF